MLKNYTDEIEILVKQLSHRGLRESAIVGLILLVVLPLVILILILGLLL